MKTLADVKEEMAACGLSDYYNAFSPLAKNAVHITLDIQEDADIPAGASKFGGYPDLPADVDWFVNTDTGIPMSFVAQINFAEVTAFDLEHKLPEKGFLYFFYDCSADGMPWGFNPEDSDGWKVFYYNGDPAALIRKDAPASLEDDDNGMLFGSARMCFESAAEIPTIESDLSYGLPLPKDEELEDQYWEWLVEKGETLSNKLLGHADVIQSGMELECEYVTHGLNCGESNGYETAISMGLDKNAAHWNLLLQVDSNEEIGMMWGDMGRLYLWISDEDLLARKFENCWLILQCG